MPCAYSPHIHTPHTTTATPQWYWRGVWCAQGALQGAAGRVLRLDHGPAGLQVRCSITFCCHSGCVGVISGTCWAPGAAAAQQGYFVPGGRQAVPACGLLHTAPAGRHLKEMPAGRWGRAWSTHPRSLPLPPAPPTHPPVCSQPVGRVEPGGAAADGAVRGVRGSRGADDPGRSAQEGVSSVVVWGQERGSPFRGACGWVWGEGRQRLWKHTHLLPASITPSTHAAATCMATSSPRTFCWASRAPPAPTSST